jgi:hypothetical protein
VHVVSGTPGRVKDMMEKTKLRTRKIKMLVLDEADEMLNLSFQEQIYNCYRWGPGAGGPGWRLQQRQGPMQHSGDALC